MTDLIAAPRKYFWQIFHAAKQLNSQFMRHCSLFILTIFSRFVKSEFIDKALLVAKTNSII